MEILVQQFAKLLELHLMKGVALDNQFTKLDFMQQQNATDVEKFHIEQSIYNLADKRAALLIQIELKRKEIIIAFHKQYETCLLDVQLDKKIEYFTGR